jgi:hypothetical protein
MADMRHAYKFWLEILKGRELGRPRLRCERLCGLVIRVLGYRSGGPGSILGTTRKKMQWVWNGVHSAS